jgi:hypothetical protein
MGGKVLNSESRITHSSFVIWLLSLSVGQHVVHKTLNKEEYYTTVYTSKYVQFIFTKIEYS